MSDSNSSLDETIKMRSSSPGRDEAQATQRIPGRAAPEPAGASSEEIVKQSPPVESDLQPTQQAANPASAPETENQPTVQVQVGPLLETQPTLPRSASTADQPTIASRPPRPPAPVSSVGEPKPFIRRGGGFSFSTISPWVLVAAAAIGFLLILFGIALVLTARNGVFWASKPTPTATLAPTATATLTPPPTVAPPTSTAVPATATSVAPTATPRPAPTALEVGVLAKVTPPAGLKLKVRGTAGVAGELLGELEADSQVKIVEGPLDANNLKWWKVDNGQGLVGWSAEGSGGETYLAPVGWAQ